MTKIIAFAGRKQSGKTTCSQYIENLIFRDFQYFLRSKLYNFADPLKKDICMNILNMTYDQCYGTDDDKNTLTDCYLDNQRLTAREVMQYVGTDFFRKMKQDVWASATINKINQDKTDIAIIADCRFPNEVETIKQAGGYVIKLMRDPFHSDHSSETALDPENYPQTNFDLIIFNQSLTIDEQNSIVHNFLKNKEILPL
jgi:hypothetical protein